jgi:hypothetical protein
MSTSSFDNANDKAEAMKAITLQAKKMVISSCGNDRRSKATTAIATKILEMELTMQIKMQVVEEKIEILKEMILFSRKSEKPMDTNTFLAMRKVQGLESQLSKSVEDINDLSDLLVEMWSDRFTNDVNYERKAAAITERPAVRSPQRATRRSSYKDVETLLKTVGATPLGV